MFNLRVIDILTVGLTISANKKIYGLHCRCIEKIHRRALLLGKEGGRGKACNPRIVLYSDGNFTFLPHILFFERRRAIK